MNYVLIIIGLLLIFLSYKESNILAENKVEGQVDKDKISFENDFESNLVLQEYNNNLKYIIETLNELKTRIENIEISLLSLSEDINTFKKELLSEFENNKDNKELNFDNIGECYQETVDLNKEIYNMTLQGLSVEEISSKLNIGKGEVLLRLGLIKAKK